jgi:hypothetical protein
VYLSKDLALRLVEEAATERHEAERVFRTAVRDAIISNASLDSIARLARTSIDNIRAMCQEPFLPPLIYATRD